MPTRKTIFNLIIVIVVLGVVFVAYRFFLNRFKQRTADTEQLIKTTAVGQAASSDEFLDLLLGLKKIELKGDILQTSFFQGLVDFKTELASQTPGRVNPFAPIGQGGRATGRRSGLQGQSGTTSRSSFDDGGAGARRRLLDQLR